MAADRALLTTALTVALMSEAFSVSIEQLPHFPSGAGAYASPRAAAIVGPCVTRVHLCSTPDVDEGGRISSPGNARAQAEEMFANLCALLQRCGGAPEDLASIDTYMVADAEVVKAVRDVRDHVVGTTHAGLELRAAPVAEGHLAAVQAYAVIPRRGQSFSRDFIALRKRGGPRAVALEFGGFRHLYAGGLDGSLSRGRSLGEQARKVFGAWDRVLRAGGLSLHDAPRVHIYYDGPYQQLRDARHEYFRRHRLEGPSFPASTGVQTPVAGGRIATKLRAVKSVGPRPVVNRPVAPRTQSEAFDYGSWFTRARLVETDIAELEVSGTASMGRDGQVKYAGRPRAQMRKTHENILDLLDACGLGYEHCVRHLTYLLRPKHVRAWEEVLRQTAGPLAETPPLSVLQATICWGQLFVEDEVTAVGPRAASAP